MTSVYRNPAVHEHRPKVDSYSGYVEPDTRVPPKARAVIKEVSVNGVTIAESEIMAEAQNHPADNPGAALAQAARALVIRELLLQEAGAQGIAATPHRGGDGRTETAEDAAITLLLERFVQVPQASERECRRFFDQNPSRFRSETILEARHILITADATGHEGKAAARTLAENICATLADDPDSFASLAEIHSACPSRQQGGNLGQLTRGSTVPEFEKALDAIDTAGSTAHIVESRYGVHVVVVDRRIEGSALPFEAVQERIAAWLQASSWSKAVSQYIAILAGRADIRGIALAAADGSLVQ
jgi:peptidyl-prolyl cis-trans isomerase C